VSPSFHCPLCILVVFVVLSSSSFRRLVIFILSSSSSYLSSSSTRILITSVLDLPSSLCLSPHLSLSLVTISSLDPNTVPPSNTSTLPPGDASASTTNTPTPPPATFSTPLTCPLVPLGLRWHATEAVVCIVLFCFCGSEKGGDNEFCKLFPSRNVLGVGSR
jgi:hypothetical protein